MPHNEPPTSTFRPKWMLCFFVSMVWTLNLKAKEFETLCLGSHIIVYLFGWKLMLLRRRCFGDASLSPPSQPNHRLNEMSIGRMKRWSRVLSRGVLLDWYFWIHDSSVNWVNPLLQEELDDQSRPHRRRQTDDAKIVSWVTHPIWSSWQSCRTCKIKSWSKRPLGRAPWGSLRCLS